MNQIKKNFIYNVIYQILILIFPLITIPYVSRILGSSGIGIYSYTYSIVYYFMLIALLGINNYGNRTIAKVKDDKEKLSKNFSGIYIIQLFMTIIMILIYILYISLFNIEYKEIAFIQVLYLISCIFDVNWFFFGMEEFKLTVTRNTIVKICSLIGIFLFVKTKNDVWIYTLIMSLSTLISCIILFPFLFKKVKIVKIEKKDILKHIKPILILFIPVIAVSLYKIMDKIMLGKITTINEVGYYEQAEKIITIPMGLVTALGTVMLPRMSNLIANKKEKEVMNMIKKSISFMMFMAFPICFGLIATSSDFVPMFLGNDFNKTIFLIYCLAPTILFISFANVIRTQYLIPKEKDKIYVISVIGGAVINLILNFIFIPKYQSLGACIGTIVAELFVMLYQTISVRKDLNIMEYLKNISAFFVKSIIMFICVWMIKYTTLNGYIKIILQILTGCIVYGILNFNYIKLLINIGEKNEKRN